MEWKILKCILQFFPDTLVPSITTTPAHARETVQMEILTFALCQGERQQQLQVTVGFFC